MCASKQQYVLGFETRTLGFTKEIQLRGSKFAAMDKVLLHLQKENINFVKGV